MLREKVTRTIVSFPNTTTALAMEVACKAAQFPGRIIPVPNQITAGCGFAWCAPAEEREKVERFLAEQGLIHSAVYTIDIYDLPPEG